MHSPGLNHKENKKKNGSDLEKKLALRVDTSRGPATETLVRRGASARAADGLRSQSKIAAQKSPKGRAGTVLYTPRLRARDLAQRNESQRGQQGVSRATR